MSRLDDEDATPNNSEAEYGLQGKKGTGLEECI
jgi:hypothetical protein